MAYRPVAQLEHDETLGFSLKPPKWLRKAQPGKLIAKAAVPLAVGASFLVPAAVPLAVAAAKRAGRAIMPVVKTVRQTVATLPGPTLPEGVPATGENASAMPQTQAMPMSPVSPGASSDAPGPSGAAGSMPSWVIPAALGVAVLLFMGGRRSRRAA